MRIACLQFAPQVGDVNNNLNRADAVLSRANPKDLDLLVLPELAFSGYNFRSLQHITPYLEPTTAGITSLWARTTALKHNCYVTVGYPEKVDVSSKWPSGPEYYNSSITVNAEGETIANYRKSFLYYTDETWALEGPDGFFGGTVPGLGNVAMGICMDLNPYKFEAPWEAWEFSNHILRIQANLVILSMAWLTREDPRPYSQHPKEPDMDTLAYWLSRLEPVIRAEADGEIIVILANRCGVEEEATYAGTSAVLGINAGEVKVYGILGRGEKELLVVDTSKKPQAKLVSEPNSAASSVETATSESTVASVDTVCTSPGIGDFSIFDDGVTPISPIAPGSPEAYFGPSRTAPVEPLKSSASPSFCAPYPSSPTFKRPESPKSRNASRTRKSEHQEPALSSHDLANEPQINPHFSLKSPNPHVGLESPHSKSTAPDQFQSIFNSNDLGPRTQHTSPRPKSTIW